MLALAALATARGTAQPGPVAPVAGRDFTDAGEVACHDAPAQPTSAGIALPRSTVASRQPGKQP
jgi:hypothetical protein